MPPLSKRERSIAAKFRRFEKAKEQAKKFYDRSDRLLLEIAQAAKPRMIVRIAEDGKQLHVREAKANEQGILGWGHGAVRQYELKIVNP